MKGWWSQLGGALTPPTVADMIKFKDRLTVSKFDREHGKCNPPTPLQLAQCCVPNRRHHPIDTSRYTFGTRLLGTQGLGDKPITTSPTPCFYAISKPIISCISYHDHGLAKPEQPLFPRSRENPCDKSHHLQHIHMSTYFYRANFGNLLCPSASP